MKAKKITFWIVTGIIGAMMLMSSIMYLSKSQQVIEGIKTSGIPLYIMQLIGVAKFLGVIALLYPKQHILKEWAYAGFTFTFIGASWIHISTGIPVYTPIVALILLGISYWLSKKVLAK
jgi:hypothetical protein